MNNTELLTRNKNKKQTMKKNKKINAKKKNTSKLEVYKTSLIHKSKYNTNMSDNTVRLTRNK